VCLWPSLALSERARLLGLDLSIVAGVTREADGMAVL
jgi:hypothetical protein